jgi:hypothetical protein
LRIVGKEVQKEENNTHKPNLFGESDRRLKKGKQNIVLSLPQQPKQSEDGKKRSEFLTQGQNHLSV